MTRPFSAERFRVARKRRGIKGKELAAESGVSEVNISRISTEKITPQAETVEKLALALRYPAAFFYDGEIEVLDTAEVSFRSLAGMRAAEREAAIAAGSVGLLLSDWLEARFNLPAADVPDLRGELPEQAAVLVRRHWLLGERPIRRVLRLLESRGVRVFSLSEQTRNVDAFSFWRSERPFVFLNLFKTAEATVFDCAHELGHLVLHRHRRLDSPRDDSENDIELEAHRFAAALLMPERDVLANLPARLTARSLVHAKTRWCVSAMALARRARDLGRLTQWQYRSVCIELTKLGYRTSEPNGIEREASVVWEQVIRELWSEKVTKDDIARELSLPLDELESLVFGHMKPARGDARAGRGKDGLAVVPQSS